MNGGLQIINKGVDAMAALMKRIIKMIVAILMVVSSYYCPVNHLIIEDYVSVNVVYEPEVSKNYQKITDRENTAYMSDYYDGGRYIADHNYQNFKYLYKVKIGDTALLNINGKITRYKCISKRTAYNDGYGFTYYDGTPVRGELIIYTCNSNKHDILVTIWQSG
jgi:hypothetical protein